MYERPYKGLIPYSEEDAPFFFGREGETRIISSNLIASRLTVLYGPSGVGKSSALRAGVAHHLQQVAKENLEKFGAPELVVVLFSSWKEDPLGELKRRIRALLASGETAADGEALSDLIQRVAAQLRGDLLIVLDQFEEYFLYRSQQDADQQFCEQFVCAVNSADLKANFLISIREDALAKLDLFKGQIPQLFSNVLRIDHLGPEGARAAIEKPIQEYNRRLPPGQAPFSVDPELVTHLLRTLSTRHDLLAGGGRGIIEKSDQDIDRFETAYLQVVMTRLWDVETAAKSRQLRLSTLQQLGGAEQIVQTHIDNALSTLSAGEQDLSEQLFEFLVTPSGTKIAHTAEDLAEYAKLPVAQVRSVLDNLAGPEVRILRTVAPRYEIYHDVLAKSVLDWRRRKLLIKEQARILREAEESHKREREREKTRVLRTAVFSLSAALLIVIVLVVYAGYQHHRAREAQVDASTAKASAEQAELSAQQATQTALEQTQRYEQVSTALLDAAPVPKQSLVKPPQPSPMTPKVKPKVKPKAVPVRPALGRKQGPAPELLFRAKAEPLGYADKGREIFKFTLLPDLRKSAKALSDVKQITYRMEHPTFQNKLLIAGPQTGFTASYTGWGCLKNVVALVENNDPNIPPRVIEFPMCKALGWLTE